MRNTFFITFISLFLCVTLVFGGVTIFKLSQNIKDSLSTSHNNNGAGSDTAPLPEGGAPSDSEPPEGGTDQTPEGDTDQTPEGGTNQTDLIEMLDSPSFRYDAAQPANIEEYGISFKAQISDFLKQTCVDMGLGMVKWLCTPLDQIEKLGLQNERNIDWVSVLEAGGAQTLIKVPDKAFDHQDANGNWTAIFSLVDVKYNNINRPMFAIMYLEYADGTREYAKIPEGETVTTLSRSFGYVCVEAYNQQIIKNQDIWPSEVDSGLLKCISLSAGKILEYDNADQVPAALRYYPMFDVGGAYGQSEKINLTIGGTPYRYDIKTGVKASDGTFVNANMPFVCYTTDASVAIVENGAIKAVGSGTCKIWFYCGSSSCSFDVTVT